MRKLAIVVIASAAVASLLAASIALAAPAVNKASGGGTVDWAGGRVTYGFTAQVDAAGVVKGQAEFHHRDVFVPITNHVDINCLAVAGNNAWLGGTITKSTDPTLVGVEIVWQVQDNGQGDAAPPDMTSPVWPGVSPGFCNSMPPMGLIPWTNGNVQVR